MFVPSSTAERLVKVPPMNDQIAMMPIMEATQYAAPVKVGEANHCETGSNNFCQTDNGDSVAWTPKDDGKGIVASPGLNQPIKLIFAGTE